MGIGVTENDTGVVTVSCYARMYINTTCEDVNTQWQAINLGGSGIDEGSKSVASTKLQPQHPTTSTYGSDGINL